MASSGECRSQQEEEMEVLKSIYSEEEFLKLNNDSLLTNIFSRSGSVVDQPPSGDPSGPDESGAGSLEPDVVREAGDDGATLISGDFSSHLKLEGEFTIKDFTSEHERTSVVKFLPPIVLGFELPADYPVKSPPRFNLSCKWLLPNQLTVISHKLDLLWKENEGEIILFTWFDFLQHESLLVLEITDSLEIREPDKMTPSKSTDPRVIQDIASLSLLFDTLVEYDATMKQLEFERSSWPCAVCYSDRLGSESFKFNVCGHIYCKDCMTQHFTVRIESGEVKQLTCPEDKCDTQAHPSQLKELLDAELFSRYEKLLLQTALDGMPDVSYCPRTFCQTALVLDPDSDMVTCSGCHFVFCKQCKQSYHGIHPCQIRKDAIKSLLEGADEESIAEYKERYGRKFVEALCREVASYAWVEKNCEPCPKCNIQVTKGDGCNKMVCSRCKVYFCWLCKAILPRGDPYGHYRSGLGCKLFPIDEDPEIDFQNVAMEEFLQDL